jgi:hypothetical protein
MHIIDKVEEILSKKIRNKKVKVTVFAFKDIIGNYTILD